ncbi:MAG: glycosyltransferase family 4 protein [Cyclobacteriaceae bacterium]|nr:glycosyltransferase family 4 protein [Cyclobacteriaceae bacterium]
MSKSLFIFSDTPFYRNDDGVFVFEPTLREIEEIAELFDTIIWMSYTRGSLPPENSRKIRVNNIHLIALPDFRGGSRWYNKFKVMFSLPCQFFLLMQKSRTANIVHARGPSVPALLVLLMAFFKRKKIYWYKYAGNWDDTNVPVTYGFQRWFIQKLRLKNLYITVNGSRKYVHERFFNFENPCLSEAEWIRAQSIRKDFSGLWNICFVGNLAPFKGATRLIDALSNKQISDRIRSVWVVGDGDEMQKLLQLRLQVPYQLYLPGNMSRDVIFSEVYTQCHFIVLPSESEGFPKVIAESAAHRCIPIATNISALNQHIKHGVNGFFLQDASPASIRSLFVEDILTRDADELQEIADKAVCMSKAFTYEKFRQKVKKTFLESAF